MSTSINHDSKDDDANNSTSVHETLVKQSSPWFLREAGRRLQHTIVPHRHAPKTQPPVGLLSCKKYQPMRKPKTIYEDAQRQWLKSQVL
jgi:hypothetical protein